MKSSIIAMSIAAMLAFGIANAATPAATPAPAKAKTAQQQKMSDCAKANKGKKGDDYKNSVSACMKGSSAATPAATPPAAPATTPPTATKDKGAQQQKMADCAKANKGKKGDDYKNAMNSCLKK
jgi:hypothetical protein